MNHTYNVIPPMNHSEQIWNIAFATVATRLIEQGATRLEAARKADAIADEVQLAYQDSPEYQWREQCAARDAIPFPPRK